MEAIVLAGGFGTRLQSIVNDIPKPMAPINDKPFLEYLLKYLQKNGITRVILCIGYKGEQIQQYFHNKYDNIEIVYSIENTPLGTGGAIKQAMQYTKDSQVVIVNGDTFFNINLKMLKLHKSKIQIALKKMSEFERYGSVLYDKNGYVTEFKEKEYVSEGYINGGTYLVSKEIFSNYDLSDNFSFEEFLQTNFRELQISVKNFEDYFIDIGIPEDYQKAQTEIVQYT